MDVKELERFRKMRSDVLDYSAAEMADKAIAEITKLQEEVKKLQIELSYTRKREE